MREYPAYSTRSTHLSDTRNHSTELFQIRNMAKTEEDQDTDREAENRDNDVENKGSGAIENTRAKGRGPLIEKMSVAE